MANQPQHQQQPNQQPRKDFDAPPAKQAPGRGQTGKSSSDRPGTRPQDPADLGHDPEPDNVQAGRMGQSGEKSSH